MFVFSGGGFSTLGTCGEFGPSPIPFALSFQEGKWTTISWLVRGVFFVNKKFTQKKLFFHGVTGQDHNKKIFREIIY